MWFDSAWTRRASITVDVLTGGPTVSAQVALSGLPDVFWNNVNQTDGRALLDYNLSGFNAATRSGIVQVNAFAFPGAYMCHAHLYWGNAAAVAASTTVTGTPSRVGHVDSLDAQPAGFAVPLAPEKPGRTVPIQEIQKTANAVQFLWWDASQVLMKRRSEDRGRRFLEEIDWVVYGISDSGGVPQAGMINQSLSRVVNGAWVRTLVQSGVSGSQYIVDLEAATTLGRRLTGRVLLTVRDTSTPPINTGR